MTPLPPQAAGPARPRAQVALFRQTVQALQGLHKGGIRGKAVLSNS